MATQKELDKCYIQMTKTVAQLSKAVRKKVGCVLVTPENVMLSSYNGTPSGWDNCCEDVHTSEPFEYLVTREDVIHAELNAINFAAKHGISLDGATLYCSLQPCMQCSKNLPAVGIKRIVFDTFYDRVDNFSDQVEYLARKGVIIEKLLSDEEFAQKISEISNAFSYGASNA